MTVAGLHGPTGTLFHNLGQFAVAQFYSPASSDPSRNVTVKGIGKIRCHSPQIALDEWRRQQPYAAVDVESDAARRYHAVLTVCRRNSADGKTITPMNVRHRNRRSQDAGQSRDVRDLFQ